MSNLETDLSVAPYNDDYDVGKRFYRILFVPIRPVQVRELNQMQSIFQEQIRRFGNHVFKDGSVVNGCNIQYVPTLPYVRLDNGWNTASANVAFDSSLQDFLVVSPTTGVRASIRLAKQGYQNLYPNTNVLYVDYIANGRDIANNQIRKFQSGETLNVYDTTQSKLADVLDSGKLYNTIDVLTANVAANQVSTGSTYAVSIGEGIVYQKGFFVNVIPHTITVRDFSVEVDNYLVGFNTAESIVNHLQDLSLRDPNNTTSNSNAPGADRLRLIPTLVSKQRSEITADDDFFPIIEFSNGKPVVQNTEPEYAKLGDVLASHIVDQAGDYYVKPFVVSSESTANTSEFAYAVSAGVGYVKGNRVELLSTRRIPVARATETDSTQASVTTLNYGYFGVIDELVGMFDTDQLGVVDIYDAAQDSITDIEGSTSAPSGTKVGTANIRAVVWDNGTKGGAACQYRAYLTNIIMNSGKSFGTDAKSIYADSVAYGKAKADFVLEAGRAVIKETGGSTLIFNTGIDGLKRLRDSTGVNDTQFYIRDTASATLQSNGSVTFTLNSPHAGGNERFFASVGTLSNANELRIDVVTSNSAYTTSKAGTVNSTTTGNNLIGTSTVFQSDYVVGDTVRVAANSTSSYVRTVVSIASNTSMQLNAPIAQANALAVHSKYFDAGRVLNLTSGADVVVISNTQFSVNLANTTFDAGAPQTVYATFPVLRTQAVAATKIPRKTRFVKIDCSTGGVVGPWNLGITDMFQLEAVYVGATYSTSNPNRISWFTSSNGQNASFYDHAKLFLKPSVKGYVTSATRILIQLSYFEHDLTSGIGFFSVDSYPARLPGVAANTTNISFSDIPSFGGYNLRNCIDLRPSKYNTAADADTVGAATVNPTLANTSFNVVSSGTYLGEPDTNFQADIEYYLPRVDLIQINKDGSLNVNSSAASLSPRQPTANKEAMAIASAYIPPFPSVATGESNVGGNQKIAIKQLGNRGYTMKDTNTLDQRISRLEYMQTLSMLEAQAKDYVIRDENGLDRFKNGIFADPFTSHLLGDYSNFEYNISIDPQQTIARPKIDQNPVDLAVFSQANTVVNGQIMSLPYSPTLFISQDFASKFRNVTESVWQWSGNLGLYPSYDHFKDTTALPDINVTLDLTTPWDQFASSPFATNFGDWRTTAQTTTTANSSLSSSNTSSTGTTTTTTSQSIATTLTTVARNVNTIQVASTQATYDLGTSITDITINPFMRSREVAFIATGLKPNAKFWVFFDKTPVSQHCAPATTTSAYNTATRTVTVTAGNESAVVARSAAWGTQLVSNAKGDIAGLFRIPNATFRIGDREFLIIDVDSLITGDDAATSQSRATYTASSMSTSTRETNLNTISPVISSTTMQETQVRTATQLTTRTNTVTVPIPLPTANVVIQVPVVPEPNPWRPGLGEGAGGGGDPLGQSFPIYVPANVPGIFLSQIGVFFKRKDPTLGISCKICEVLAGVPDSSRIVATAYLKPSEIGVSSNGATETKFTFGNIPYLTSNKFYVFFLQPDGNSPEYQAFMAEIGGTDILTGQKIFSNPNIGVAFVSANSTTWNALQEEDLKFRIYRAQFTAATGTAIFVDQNDEYLTTNGFTLANSALNVQIGDVVYSQNSTGGLLTSNSSPFGTVQAIDLTNDKLILDGSRGGLVANTILQIHRPTAVGNVSLLNANTLIANTTIKTIDNYDYSIVVPRIGTVVPFGAKVSMLYKGLDLSNALDPASLVVQPEVEREYLDKMRTIRSKSNRSVNEYSAAFNVTLSTSSNYISPMVDMRRRSALFIKNIVNDDLTDEHTRYGEAFAKYVSQKIVLAEGQDAEDIRVYVTGYRPSGTNISCYVKLLSSEDTELFEDKLWTKMTMTGGESVYSNVLDPRDYREYEFNLPTAAAMTGSAYLNLSNNNIVQYVRTDGSIFVTYKQYAIKIVLTSGASQIVPKLEDVRAIALQI